MPQPEIEALQKDSGDGQISAAISTCIANEVRNGVPQNQAVAMCSSMARDRTGGRPAPKGEK